MPKVTCSNILSVAKHEYRHIDRFSTNIFVDLAATKLFYHSLHKNKKQNTAIEGYVQDIRQNKFGVLFYCEKQVIFFVLPSVGK